MRHVSGDADGSKLRGDCDEGEQERDPENQQRWRVEAHEISDGSVARAFDGARDDPWRA